MPFGPTVNQVLSRTNPGALNSNQDLEARVKAGDPAAIAQIQQMAHPEIADWGTNRNAVGRDQRNSIDWARQVSNQYLGTNYEHSKNTTVGNAAGDLLRVAAPIGAALIPGIGPLAAGLIAAGGNAAGQLLHGDPLSVKQALLAGVGSGLGSAGLAATGGGGAAAGAIPAAPAGVAEATSAGLAGAPTSIGGLTTGLGGAAGATGAASGALAPVAAAGGAGTAVPSASVLGTLGKIGGTISKNLPLIGGVLGTIQGANQMSHANALQDQAVQTALQDWQQRAPVRAAAVQRVLAPLPTAPDLSYVYANSSNPYAKVRPA
jgi:hypothetical protein